MTYTLMVGIGRDVPGTGPMGSEDWTRFRSMVALAVTDSGHTPLFLGTGTGRWEGQEEDSYTVVALPNGEEADVEQLKAHLGALSREFGQDAIAVTVGQTTLVS